MPVPALLGARAATLPEALPPAAYIPGRNLLRLVSQLAQVVGLGLGGLLLVVFPEALANPYAAERAMTTAELGLLMASAPSSASSSAYGS